MLSAALEKGGERSNQKSGAVSFDSGPRRYCMPLYMIQFSYTPEAWAALAKHPENRAEGFSALAQKMGGRLVDVYYCFGEYDGLALVDLPSDTAATAAVIAAVSPGHVKATRTTRLMSI